MRKFIITNDGASGSCAVLSAARCLVQPAGPDLAEVGCFLLLLILQCWPISQPVLQSKPMP